MNKSFVYAFNEIQEHLLFECHTISVFNRLYEHFIAIIEFAILFLFFQCFRYSINSKNIIFKP